MNPQPSPTAAATAESGAPMPALFIGHGSPMNAIEDSAFSRAWAAAAQAIPKPKAILCVSAHWETGGTRVTAAEHPKTIYDFYGFPDALYEKRYPAPGSPELARRVAEILPDSRVQAGLDWGLDHGAWAVLCQMYPQADIPVVQLSLDRTLPPAGHYELGRKLGALRQQGVLILGSGNIVHNLRAVVWEDTAYDWALEFDTKVRDLILAGGHQALIDYPQLGSGARLAIPTPEHYLPLLYVLGAQGKGDPVSFFADKVTLGSMSMRSLRIG